MWPLWWPLLLKGLKKSHTKQGEALGVLQQTRSLLPLQNETRHQSVSHCDNEASHNNNEWSHCTSKLIPPLVGSTEFLYLLGFQVSLFLKAGSIHKAALEFNQQKSSLSHKGKALKSYYGAQSLQCYCVRLQHTVKHSGANAN